MKKAGIFAAVIMIVLLFMQFYNYKIWAYMDDVCYVIDADQAAGYLLNGVGEGEDGNLTLARYEASTPVYTRGKRYYIGQTYDALDVSYPVYTNEGSFLYSLSQDITLVTSEFLPMDAYEGIYVADGKSYNVDREQADPDEFLFISVGDGLYMNVQEMIIHSGARSHVINANSLINLTEEKAAYYSFDRGEYLYGEYRDLLYATADIGSVSLPYGELLEKLGKAVQIRSANPLPQEVTEAAPVGDADKQALSQMEDAAAGEEQDTGSKDKEEKEQGGDSQEKADAGADGKPVEAEENGSLRENGSAAHETTEPIHPPRPGRRSELYFGSDTEKEEAPENSGSPDSSGSQGGGDSSGGSGEELIQKPEVFLSEFSFGVYHTQANLEIRDPSFLMYKGVRLVFYKKGEPRASYRKLFRTGGEITIEPLEPGTEYEAEGYFEYMDPVQGKVREYFLERQAVGKTLPISALRPILVSQQPDSTEFYPHSVQITDFVISEDDQAGTATPSEAGGQYSAAAYLSSVQMSFQKSGTPGLKTPQASLGTLLLGRLKRGEKIQWKTEAILESDSRYSYELAFYDRYGNVLPLASGSRADGKTVTSKVAPKAIMTVNQDSSVKELKLNVSIENEDKAEFAEGGNPASPWLYITYADQPQAPITFRIDGEQEELSFYELKSDRETISFTSLLPSTAYTVWVKGSFDLKDGRNHEDEVIGQLLTTTDNLASLGTVSFQIAAEDITASSASVTAKTRTAVSDVLFPFLSKVELALEGGEGRVFSYALKKEEMTGKTMNPGDTYVLQEAQETAPGSYCTPEVAIYLPQGAAAMTPWEALFKNGSLTVKFTEGGLASATEYQVSARTYAVRGSNDENRKVEEDVTGRYYQSSFRTLRKKPYVDYEMSFINGVYATFYNLRVVDGDGAVVNGRLTARLKHRNNGVVKEIRTYDLNELNQMEEITFRDLDEGTRYILEFVAQEYNEGYSSATKELQKVLYLEDGSAIDFTAENTLWGSLVPDSIFKDYEQQTPELGVGMSSINLYDVNEVQLGILGNGPGGTAHESYAFTGYIPVEEGKAYVSGGTNTGTVYYYDQQKNYISSQTGYASYPGILVPPKGAAYIRLNIHKDSLAGAFISEALFTEADSPANLLSGNIKENAFIATDGVTILSGASGVGYGCVEEFIPVEAGQRYSRLRSSNEPGTWKNTRVFFYDELKNYLSYSELNHGGGTVTAPEQACYARMNLKLDSADEIFFGKMSPLLYGEDLLEGAVWHDGLYVTELNQYAARDYSYQKYCDYIPVKGGAVYWAHTARGVQFFDKNWKFLGYNGNGSNYSLKVPEEAAYVRFNTDYGDEGANLPILRQITPRFERSGLSVGMDLRLKDSNGSLGGQPEYTLEYTERRAEGGSRSWEETYEAGLLEDRSFETQVHFGAEPDCEYQIDLVVSLGARKIVLDSAVISTVKAANIVKSEAGLLAVVSAPVENYIVTRDIEVNRNKLISRFYGEIDFQGHQVTSRNLYNLFSNIHEGAVVKNLVLDSRIDDPYMIVDNLGALCHTNRGTIRNLVLRTGLDNKRDTYNFGGIALSNYGLIENFAIELQSDYYITRYGSPGAGYNYGTMRNGYLVSNEAYRIKTFSNGAGDRSARGGIAGINEGGTIENVYSAVVIEEGSTGVGLSREYMGLVAGYSRGTVRNVFGVGMTLANGLPPATYGPTVGYVSGEESHGNISYVETMNFETDAPRYGNRYNTQVTSASLWNRGWMESAINGAGAFHTDMAEGGFYPQLNMPGEMEGKQPLYRLPDQYRPAMPKILSVSVEAQEHEYAVVKIGFENKNQLEIKSMNLAVMNLTGNARTYIPDIADVEITGQEMGDDGIYYVVITVTQPMYYRSQYYVYSYTAGLAGNADTDVEYMESDREKTGIGIEFYRPVTSVDDWRECFSRQAIDRYGNYRIMAQELDFSQLSPKDYQSNYRITGSFYGNIDGAYTDRDGNVHYAVLKNMHMDQSPYLIANLYGNVSNLRIDGLTLDTERTQLNSASKGLVGSCIGGSLSGVHIKNARVDGNYYTGILAGEAHLNSVIRDCSVSDSVVESYVSRNYGKTQIGGLVGRLNVSTIENCFVQNIEIRNLEAYGNDGAGGLVGYVAQSSVSSITNCFATGSIRSRYSYVGGLVGYENESKFKMSGCYAKVDLDIYGSYVGGLIGLHNGLEEFYGNLSVGDIFVHSTNAASVRRIAGHSKAVKYDQNYGFAGQMFMDGDQMQKVDDAEELLTEKDLQQEETYLKKLQWSGSDYAFSWDEGAGGIEQGYLPMLKGSDGTILPWQKPVKVGTGNANLSITNFAINQQALNQYQTMFPGQSMPFSQAYELRIDLHFNRDQYDILSASMEGMELNERMNERSTVTDIWQNNRLIRTYPFVTEKLGGDVYCLNVVLQSKEDTDERIKLSAAVRPQNPITTMIGSAAEWNTVMREYGNSYGNFVLIGDIDAATLPPGEELIGDLKINSLSSMGGRRTIKGIRHTVDSRDNALIRDCLSGIENVNFEDITWKVPDVGRLAAYENIGLIGLNQGTIRNVNFEKIEITSGNATRTGCVAQNTGTISDVELKDIRISSEGSHTGGLAGYTFKEVQRIRAYGKLQEDSGKTGVVYNSAYESTYEIRGRVYTGGIVGQGPVCNEVEVTGIHVVGEDKGATETAQYIGGITGNGAVPIAGVDSGDSISKSTMISNSVIETPEDGKRASYVGGLSGSGNVYYGRAENVIVRSARGMNVGGLTGKGYSNDSQFKTVDKEGDIIKRSSVLGEEMVGGILGNGNGLGNQVDNVSVKALKANAGGISGLGYSSLAHLRVDRTEVEAPIYAGGIVAQVTGGSVYNNLVSRSKISAGCNIGGIIGECRLVANNHFGNGVIETEITSGKNPDTGESNAGGIAGYLQMVGWVYGNYIKDTTVLAEGSNAGGLAGAAEGGHYSQNYIHGTIESRDEGAGGLIGRLTGVQNAVSTIYGRAQLYESYSAAEVKAKSYAAGLIGIYTCRPGDGVYSLGDEEFHGLLVMGNVESESEYGDMFANADPDRAGLSCKGGYMRVYQGSRLTKGASASSAADLYPNTWDSVKPAAAGGTEPAGNSGLEGVLTVTGKNMMDKRLYQNSEVDGGMNWTSGRWLFDGLGRMDEEAEAAMNHPSTVDVLIQEAGVEKTVPFGKNVLYHAAPGVMPTAKIAEQGEYWWYRYHLPTTANAPAVKGAAGSSLELAGRGYYIGRVKMGGKDLYTPVIKVDTPGYMPYLTTGIAETQSGQEGILTGLTMDDSLEMYNGEDRLFYGGIEIPVDNQVQTLAMTEESGITAYPSGVGTVNVELGGEYMAFDSLKVTAGSRILCETRPEQRVYTLNYDYRSQLTVSVTSGSEVSSTVFDPTRLQRTVMVWGDDYYYTYDGTLRNSTGTVLQQQVLHLFGGKALTAEGDICDVSTGEKLETLTMEPWKAGDESIPIQQAEYEGSLIKTYGEFSLVSSGADTDGAVREQQLYVKNGKLYSITGKGTSKGFVLDEYNGKTYMSALNEQQSLVDFANALTTPENFSRKAISHMSDTLNTEKPYVLLRYVSGEVKGFNYLSGEELSVENAFSDISLFDFAATFFASLTEAPQEGNKSFADLRMLRENLTIDPITEEELEAANTALSGQGAEQAGGSTEENAGLTGDDAAAGAEDDGKNDEEDGAAENVKAADAGAAEEDQEARDVEAAEGGQEAGDAGAVEGVDGEEGQEAGEAGAAEGGQEAGYAEASEGVGGEEGRAAGEAGVAEGGQEAGEAEAGEGVGGEEDQSVGEAGAAEDSQAAGEAGTGESSQSAGEAGAGDEGAPGRAKASYVYSFNTDDGTCDLYRQAELLSSQIGEPVSERKKLDTLKSAGMFRDEKIIQKEAAKESQEKGIMYFTLAVTAALGLAAILVKRKRKEQKEV